MGLADGGGPRAPAEVETHWISRTAVGAQGVRCSANCALQAVGVTMGALRLTRAFGAGTGFRSAAPSRAGVAGGGRARRGCAGAARRACVPRQQLAWATAAVMARTQSERWM